jgi:hypothetical protein
MEELKLLGLLAVNHYDGHCKSVAKQGGFLYGMQNHQEFSNGAPHVLSFREIDTLCKILEMRSMLSPVESLIALNKPKLLDVASALSWRLRGLLQEINAEVRRMRPEGSEERLAL